MYKNLTTRRVYVVFFIRFFLDLIAAAKFLAEGHVRDSLAVFKAYGAFYFHLRRFRKYRRKHPQIQVSCIYKRSIVLDHYFKGKKIFAQLNEKFFTH